MLQAPRHRLLAARGLQFWTFWNVERRCSAKSIWQISISALPSSLPPGLPVFLCVPYQFPAYCFFKKLVFFEISVAMAWNGSAPNRPMVWMFELFVRIGGLEVLGGEAWQVEADYWGQALGGVLPIFSLTFPHPKEWLTIVVVHPCFHDVWAPQHAFTTNGQRQCLPPLSGFCLAFCQSCVRVINTLVVDSVNKQLFTNVEVSNNDIQRNHFRSSVYTLRVSAFLSSKIKRKATNSFSSSPFTTWLFNLHRFSLLSKYPLLVYVSS